MVRVVQLIHFKKYQHLKMGKFHQMYNMLQLSNKKVMNAWKKKTHTILKGMFLYKELYSTKRKELLISS